MRTYALTPAIRKRLLQRTSNLVNTKGYLPYAALKHVCYKLAGELGYADDPETLHTAALLDGLPGWLAGRCPDDR